METVDLSQLKNNDLEYEKIAADLAEHYKCDWDDSVHDSYGRYVKQIQDNSKIVHTIRCKIEILVKEVDAFDIEKLREQAVSLEREVESM